MIFIIYFVVLVVVLPYSFPQLSSMQHYELQELHLFSSIIFPAIFTAASDHRPALRSMAAFCLPRIASAAFRFVECIQVRGLPVDIFFVSFLRPKCFPFFLSFFVSLSLSLSWLKTVVSEDIS